MLSQEMLRKYITFAKQNCHPRLANANVEKISQVSWAACVTSMQPRRRNLTSSASQYKLVKPLSYTAG